MDKKDRREKKRTLKRSTTGKEVLFIFEKVLIKILKKII